MTIETNPDVNFGTMLLEKKLITEEQLKVCVDQYRVRGGYLSQYLIEAGYIKDSDLTTSLTCQYGYCYLPLKSYAIEDNALQAIAPQYIYDYSVMPIEKNDKILTVVMSDPTNKGVIEMLRRVSRCEIVVFISTRSDVRETIEKHYHRPCGNFELDKFINDAVLRDDLITKKVSNGIYLGPNRRRYRRLYLETDLEYYAYPDTIKTKVLNVSISGLLLESNTAIPKGTQMAINLKLGDRHSISGVVEVARCESIKMTNTVFGDDSPMFYFYEIGVFFNFLTVEDQNILADFLRKKLGL
jgi:hypothetical protein